MNSPAKRRSDKAYVIVGIFLAVAGITTGINSYNDGKISGANLKDNVKGTIQARYVGHGPTFYFAVDMNGERVEVSVSEDEFEFYNVGDYFLQRK